MRWLPFAILIFIGTLLEAGNLLNVIALGQWHIRPAVLIVLLVFYAAQMRTHEALVASFIIGLLMDISGSQMGPHTVSYLLIGGLVHQAADHLRTHRINHQALMIFAAYLAAALIAYWLGALKTGQRQEYAVRIVLLTGFYSACIGPFFWSFLLRVNRGLIAAPSQTPRQRGYFR